MSTSSFFQNFRTASKKKGPPVIISITMDNPAVNHRRGTDETLIPPGKTQFTSEKEQQKKFDPTTPHGENGRSSPPPGRFKRFRAHLRRCWMWYLGGSLLFNTIFVILL